MPLPKNYDKELYGKIVGHLINSGYSQEKAHKSADKAMMARKRKIKKK